jgi:hypothetical protein
MYRQLSLYSYVPPAQHSQILFSTQNARICFSWISEQTAIISLYSINLLVLITAAEDVCCAVRTGSLNQTATVSSFVRVLFTLAIHLSVPVYLAWNSSWTNNVFSLNGWTRTEIQPWLTSKRYRVDERMSVGLTDNSSASGFRAWIMLPGSTHPPFHLYQPTLHSFSPNHPHRLPLLIFLTPYVSIQPRSQWPRKEPTNTKILFFYFLPLHDCQIFISTFYLATFPCSYYTTKSC